ncbi:transposable element Tcb1 transposase [Trichonephila clavipes]|nr:transposable element Tcb1 transposase [Trichonephila clavipes]
MMSIIRHNDAIVKKGYMKNDGKEVKLLTSVQCHNRVVETQMTHGRIFSSCRIIGHLECRCTQTEVSKQLGITQCAISCLWERFQDDGTVNRRFRTGHPHVTTYNADLYLAAADKRSRRSRTTDLSRQLPAGTGTTDPKHTVYRRLGIFVHILTSLSNMFHSLLPSINLE